MHLNEWIQLLTIACCIKNCTCGVLPLCKRVINGRPSLHPVTWPWLLSIKVMNTQWCGASLIADEWALTAAHCFYDGHMKLVHPGKLVVVAGGKRATGQDGIPCHIIQTVIHPVFNPLMFPGPYDIALIRLSHRLHITPARLPVSQAPITNAECWVAGWGFLTAPIKSCPLVLLEAPLPLVEPFHCDINPTLQLCAGGLGCGPCQGDSGGPLFCKDNGMWVLQGITSYGNEQCVPFTPCVFTRVNAFIEWIALTLAGARFGLRSVTNTPLWPMTDDLAGKRQFKVSASVRGMTRESEPERLTENSNSTMVILLAAKLFPNCTSEIKLKDK